MYTKGRRGGGQCVYGLKETELAASEERGGGDKEAWDGLVRKQLSMPPKN